MAKLDLPIRLQHHPAVLEEQERRAADLQLRIADWITAYAGSMHFVYLHIALFAVWMLFIESKPWPTLTLIVSLEAIFLSTFVMIGQNRQAAFQQAKADHDFTEQELELKTNTELTREIHKLTTELHRRMMGDPPSSGLDGRQVKPAPARSRRPGRAEFRAPIPRRRRQPGIRFVVVAGEPGRARVDPDRDLDVELAHSRSFRRKLAGMDNYLRVGTQVPANRTGAGPGDVT